MSSNLPPTPTDKEMEDCMTIIKQTIEPSMQLIIDKLNEHLAARHILVGVELKWIFQRKE